MNGVFKKYPGGGSWDRDGGWDHYDNAYGNTRYLFDKAMIILEAFAALDQPFYMEITHVAGKYSVKSSSASDPRPRGPAPTDPRYL